MNVRLNIRHPVLVSFLAFAGTSCGGVDHHVGSPVDHHVGSPVDHHVDSPSCPVTGECQELLPAGQRHPCIASALLAKPGGASGMQCEYGPKLAGACRCHPHDVRQCTKSDGATGTMTCAVVSRYETKWGDCT